ncbi:hypothetical protein HPB49_004546 [Dermacentor silvarum]|uniref:Uncharacterized protein n=1 Tax=Dermacentor silvarum TaxID=543639 RepID=A0ACB8DAL9_DERSI|nr:hypothetical protein HPB49_004546 [Dermacentor silvarum]
MPLQHVVVVGSSPLDHDGLTGARVKSAAVRSAPRRQSCRRRLPRGSFCGSTGSSRDGVRRLSMKRSPTSPLVVGAKRLHFDLGTSPPLRSPLQSCVQSPDVLSPEWADGVSHSDEVFAPRPTGITPDTLLKWFVDAQSLNILISGPLILSKARSFASLLDFPNFSPGNGWLHRFRAHHGIVFETVTSEADSVNIEDVDAWLSKNITTIGSYALRDTYNANETVLLYHMLPPVKDTCAGGKHSKLRVAILLCMNMDGSDRQLPFVIGKSRKLRCFGSYIPVRSGTTQRPGG